MLSIHSLPPLGPRRDMGAFELVSSGVGTESNRFIYALVPSYLNPTGGTQHVMHFIGRAHPLTERQVREAAAPLVADWEAQHPAHQRSGLGVVGLVTDEFIALVLDLNRLANS